MYIHRPNEEYSNANVEVCNAPHDVTDLVQQPTALNDWPALNFKFIDQVRFEIKSQTSPFIKLDLLSLLG